MLTISDGVHHGAREDRSGAVLEERALAAGHEVAWRGVLPDERDEIAACFARLCDEDVADVVLSTGRHRASRRATSRPRPRARRSSG